MEREGMPKTGNHRIAKANLEFFRGIEILRHANIDLEIFHLYRFIFLRLGFFIGRFGSNNTRNRTFLSLHHYTLSQ